MNATKKSFHVIDNFFHKVEDNHFAKEIIFGDAITTKDITIVPVAKIKYGFGFGLGEKFSQEGKGAGAGISATPIGYIEIHNGKTKFKKIRSSSSLLSVSASVVIIGLFLFHITKKIILK